MDRRSRRDPERYVRYGITDSWEEMVETLPGAPVSTDTELGAHMREFESMVRRDTDEIYTRLDDEQGQRQLLAGRVNMLFRDRRGHAHTRQLMETEAGMSREAWGRAMDASDLAHGEDTGDRERFSDLLEIDRRRREEMRELRACLSQNLDSSSLFDLDCYADTTERRRSTSGTGHHTAGAGDSLTGTGDCISRGRLLPTWTTGTAGGPAPPKRGAARGGW
ncbi:hypothetical protein Tco_0052488 [Tanacetum coccineum]